MHWKPAVMLLLALVTAVGETVDASFDRALQIYRSQGVPQALPVFQQSLAGYQNANNLFGEAKALNAIGICYNRLGEFRRALQFYQRSLAIKDRLGNALEIGKTHNNIGYTYIQLADYDRAQPELQQALAIARSAGNQTLEGDVENNLGLCFMNRGSYTVARGHLERALQLGNNDGLDNIGGIYQLLGRNREALPYYEQYLALSRGKADEGHALGNLALAHLGVGEIAQSLALYERAIALAKGSGARSDEADWHKGKGSALRHVGRYGEALAEYEQALTIYEHAGLRQKNVECLADLGYLYFSLGDFASAEKQFNSGLALAHSIGDKRSVITLEQALGELASGRKQYSNALAAYRTTVNLARQAGDRMSTAEALVDMALNEIEQRDFTGVGAEITETLNIARAVGAKLIEARALYARGELARLRKEPAFALTNYAAGEKIATESGDTELIWRLAFGSGRALQSLGRRGEAIIACRRAVTTIESVRNRLREERFQAGFLEDKYDVYVLLVQLFLENGQLAEAFEYTERLHARGYAELAGHAPPHSLSVGETVLRERIRQLQQALDAENGRPARSRRSEALQSYSRELADAERAYEDFLDDLNSSGSPSAPPHLTSVPAVEAIQLRLAADAAVLEYLVAGDEVVAFVITAKTKSAQQLRVRKTDLVAKVGLLRDLIGRPPGDEWRLPAASLADLLVVPLERKGLFEGIHRLYIVPHQALHYLPFACLPRNNRPMADDYAISYLPSAAMLVGERRETDQVSPKKSLLALSPAGTGLMHADEEARAVRTFFPPPNLLLTGVSATEQVFKREAASYDVLHLATHASFNELRPLFSSLQLQPGGGEDGRLEVREILDLRLRASLVTLSACGTARGSGYLSDAPAGDDFIGFARAFLYAGAQAVLASLWEVDDLSTAKLMSGFYRRQSTGDKALALAAAQQELRRSNPRYQHPFYWAPFVLVGKM